MPFISGISMSMVTRSGLSWSSLRDGDLAVDGGAHDLDVGVGGQHVGHDLADDDGIVDDHHPDRVHACPPASLLGQPSRLFISVSAPASRPLSGAGIAMSPAAGAARGNVSQEMSVLPDRN